MTAQSYIRSKLLEVGQPAGTVMPGDNEQLADAIFRIIMSKKFRKYSASPEFIEHIKSAIRLNIERGEPINVTFTHGAYKLWRLEESPEVDWAELFALMHYTRWLKTICEIYEPGVWFDSFVDDLILTKLNNTSQDDIVTYKQSYQSIMDFLRPIQPKNFRMTITGVSEQFESPEAFESKLEQDVANYAANLSDGLPVVTEARAAMIELNSNPSESDREDPHWHEKNTLVHDAYISLTKRETGYTFRPDKILAFTQPLPSGVFLGVGSTKDSIAKFWTGVGALKPRDGSYRQIILSPTQLKNAKFNFEEIHIDGLKGKNFSQIRVLH